MSNQIDDRTDGKLDQAGGRVKEGMADVKDAAKDAVDDLTD